MIDPIEIIETEEQTTATIHLNIRRDQIQAEMGPAIQEVFSELAKQNVQAAGPVFSYHARLDPMRFDFEVGVPVNDPVEPAGRMRPSTLPGAKVAKTIYRGPYEGLGPAWRAFDAAIRNAGHAPAQDFWERYSKGPSASADPAEWETELSRRVMD